MASSDLKQRIQQPSKPSARNTKQPSGYRAPTLQLTNDLHSNRTDFLNGFITKGSKISGADIPGRQKKPNNPSANSVKGMTLEEYIRSTNERDKSTKTKENNTVKIKYDDLGLCFDRTFEIEEEDEQNESQKPVDTVNPYNGLLPEIRHSRAERAHRKIKHIQTEICEDVYDVSPQVRGGRLMTSYNQEMYLPIHSLGKDRPHLRRSFYRREQRSRSNSHKEQQTKVIKTRSKDIAQLAKRCLNYKTNTLSDFYQVRGPSTNRHQKSLRMELGYVTKNHFRMDPFNTQKNRKRQL